MTATTPSPARDPPRPPAAGVMDPQALVPELVERDGPLALALARVAGLRHAGMPTGGCIAVSGEAGTGKTSLLRALQRLTADQARWMWGSCEPMRTPPPLGPLLDMLDDLPPSLAALVRNGGALAELLSGMRRLLAEASEPLVVVVDDCQWADSATLDLLRFLGRRLQGSRSLLVLAWRDEEVGTDHPLRLVLAGLPVPDTLQLALQPLSPQAVATLARRAGRSAEGLHAVTAGNPFFVHALLAQSDPAAPLAATVRDAVLARLPALSPLARQLLSLVSLMPGMAEASLLQALAPAALQALPECVEARLLVCDADGVRFRHELARQAVASAVPAALARDWHARAHAHLQSVGASAARQLHHAECADLRDALAPLAAAAAREAAMASAHRQAAALYALALRHADGEAPAASADLAEHHAAECLLINQPAAALQSLQQAWQWRLQAGDRPGQGRTLQAQAQVLWLMQRRDEAQARAHQALPLLRDAADHGGLALAYATLSQVHLHEDDLQPARVWGHHALAQAEQRGDSVILVDALNSVACAELRQDDLPAAWAQLQRSLALARQHELPGPAARAWANLAGLGMVHGHLQQVLQWCADGIAWCEAHELDLFEVRLRLRRGHAWLMLGEWALVTDALAGIRARTGLNAIELEQADYLGQLLALRQGEEDAALLAAWRALADGHRRLAVKTWYSPLDLACVEAAWLADEPARALSLATLALAASHDPFLRGQLACWVQRLGGVPDWAGRPVASACLAELQGRPLDAARLWAGMGRPWEQALALMQGGEAGLRQALPVLDRLGARGLARQARRALRQQGVRDLPRGAYRAARSDPMGLTRREREIWQALAEGLSNRAIAERLNRSERTVEHHVSTLLVKLGCADRHAARQRWQAGGTAA